MNRIKNVPVIPQMEELEGGASCLAMILAYLGKWVSLDQVRTACGISRDGISDEHIRRGAESFGLQCEKTEMAAGDLRAKAPLPAIVLCGEDRWRVLCGFRKNKVQLIDPEKGRIAVSFGELEKEYAGTLLALRPGKDFKADGKRNGILQILRSAIRGNRRAMMITMVTGMLAALGGLFAPAFTRTFTDDILTSNRLSWYPGILYAFAGLIVFQTVAAVVHQIAVARATGRVAVRSNAAYMRHLLRLPMSFFARRKAGDLANRQEENDTVANTLIGVLAPLLINLMMLVFYLVIMIQYSVVLTCIGVGTIAINMLLIKRLGRIRREMTSTQFRDQANLNSATVSGIDMVETIKATGSENGYFERWSGFHAAVIRAKERFMHKTQFLATLPTVTKAFSENTILLAGFWLIIRGQFTAGLLLTFLQFFSALMTPVNELLEAGESINVMGASVERIRDVMDYPEEEEITPERDDGEVVQKLSGTVEMSHVTFGYSRFGEPLLKDFSLKLTPGKRIALVGASGSGKSTIAKLLSGLYQPWEGEIRFDGKKIREIPRDVFKASLSMVDQEITIFHDTVDNNIKMWDASIEDYEMVLASRDAGIHDQIVSRKGGYQMVLREGGRNLSGGERQRIEIARVLAMDPTILILDEATSALDARTEFEISNSVRDRGMTCVIVAHRLSTIRDCDEIIVLERGRVVERGTHEQLMAAGGYYQSLIMTA